MEKHLRFLLQLSLLVVFLFGSVSTFGQVKPIKNPVPRAAVEHLKKNKQKLNLEDADIAELEISSETETKKSGLRHLYVKQLHQGIEIHGAITTVNLDRNEKVVAMSNRFHKQVSTKVKTIQPGLSAEAAVAAAATYLKTSIKEPLTVKERGNGLNKQVLFTTGGISLEPIPAKLVYQPMEDGRLVLAWEVTIYELDAQNWWNLRLDAATGKVLDKDNLVIHCEFDNNGAEGKSLHANHGHGALSPNIATANYSPATAAATGAYRVFAMPVESPIHGPRSLVSASAADEKASPNGWHYTPIGNMTTTRGNNVYAYEDPNGLNPFPTAANNYTVNNYSPDGGPNLIFDFPIDFTKEPETYVDAATTNLFYWNNIIHDVWYQYGFDEASGNFQFDNFGRGGAGNDFVRAEAQDARVTSANGPQRNNANFGTPVDGSLPRMQMYLWSGKPDADMFRITSPGAIAGSYQAVPATFGAPLTPSPITGKLVLVNGIGGTSTNPVEGCGALTNGSEIAGNIAVVYRGNCEFGVKVLNAQQAGAVAVVVINNAPGAPTSMGVGATNPALIQIPALMTTDIAGAAIMSQLADGKEVTVSLKNDGTGPEYDGDFDNGIIVHEYGHGISNRLAGGRLVANCLNNAEQMGEGWSDWFGLVMTMQPGDTPGKLRGIGTYPSGQPTDGRGIRPAPYSTDFSVNPFTYAATNSTAISQPHGVGFVWSTMLWDMTWDLIAKYGYDEDLYNGTGGNNMAMQLVIDGLKLQACRPGFVDGRDAILAADMQNYGGANQELIWRAFAKRGLGFSASQGLNTSRFDQVEAFDLPLVYACDAPTIVVTPSSNVFTGGDDNVIYLGYGAQSVMLTAIGDPTFTYTWSPAEGLSDANIENPVFTPSAPGTYTFTVTAVNENGCTRTASVTITVIEVRETPGNSRNTKVMVCQNGKTIVVASAAVAAHLKNGHRLGNCSMSTSGTATANIDEQIGSGNLISSYPNPFSESATISFTAEESGFTTLKVYDVTGRMVATLFEGNAENGVVYSETFKAAGNKGGVYIYRLVNGNTMKSGKMLLIK